MNSQKVELGRVTIPDDKQKWMKYVSRDGTIYASPPGGRKYTPAQQANVKSAVKQARAVFVRKAKQLRDAKNTAYQALKKHPMEDKLRENYAAAERALLDFDKGRKASEAKAKRDARDKALK